MAKFDVRVVIDFNDVEAEDYDAMIEMIDNAVGQGAVLFNHPNTNEQISSDYKVTEKE